MIKVISKNVPFRKENKKKVFKEKKFEQTWCKVAMVTAR